MSNSIITVLSDESTWSAIEGSYVYVMRPEQYVAFCEEGDTLEGNYFQRFSLKDPAHLRALATFLESKR